MINQFGHLFTFSTFGESHGKALGCVVDGVPAGIDLTEADIQPYLNARKPGQSKFTTQRQEADEVEILSGTFEGKTTGHPIGLLIHNTDQKSKDYGEIKDQYRPGHADYTFDQKYGIRDYRGGGRASARETAMRVAAGAIARKVISGVTIKGGLVQLGEKRTEIRDWSQVSQNPLWVPDAGVVEEWQDYLDAIRKDGSSVGAVIEIVAEGVPVGLGEPVYGKLDSRLADAMMSINAVKGVEMGDGFAAAALRGEHNADEMRIGEDGKPVFQSNHAGGSMGGISTGQPVVCRFAVKPTSSLLTPVQSIDKAGNEVDVRTKGRHDPCVGIRAVPVGEAMMACVLADLLLMDRARKHF